MDKTPIQPLHKLRTVKLSLTPQEAELLDDLLDIIETISCRVDMLSHVAVPGSRCRAEFSSLSDKAALARARTHRDGRAA